MNRWVQGLEWNCTVPWEVSLKNQCYCYSEAATRMWVIINRSNRIILTKYKWITDRAPVYEEQPCMCFTPNRKDPQWVSTLPRLCTTSARGSRARMSRTTATPPIMTRPCSSHGMCSSPVLTASSRSLHLEKRLHVFFLLFSEKTSAVQKINVTP